MKKKFFSLLTTFVMLFAIVGVMPKMEVGAATSNDWSWPTSYHSIQSDWPNYSSGKYHAGTDFPVALNSPVYSTCYGEVVAVTSLTTSYGKHIKIKATVNGSIVYMRYCHLNSFNVRVGDTVHSGQLIAYSGSTGNSTGPHLHYEVRDANDRYGSSSSPNLNPRNYLPGSSYSFYIPKDPILPGVPDPNYAQPVNVTAGHKCSTYDQYGDVESGRYIDQGDNCYIEAVYTNGFVKIKYPTKSGDRWSYAKTSDFDVPIIGSIILPGEIDPRYATPTNVTANRKINTYDQYGHVESNRYIDPGDNCYIEAVYTNGFVKVQYPTPSGNRWSYAKTSDLIPDPIILPGEIDPRYATPTNVTADHKINTYDQCGHVESNRYIDPGDNCYIEAVYTNGFVKVKYPTPSGDRWSYAKTSDFPIQIIHEHSYGSWTIVKSVTCTSDGQETRTCSSCGESETRTIATPGHEYTVKVIAPTFAEQGYDFHTCSVCGDSYKDNYTDMKIKGDVNNDSSVGVSDVVFLQQYLVKSRRDISSEQFLAADMNSDGQVNVFDVVILKRRILKNA